MLVTPLPGVNLNVLLEQLRQLGFGVSNIKSGLHDGKYSAYIGWVSKAVRALRHQVRAADLDRLVLTRRYWLLQSLNPVPNSSGFGATIELLDTEIDDRGEAIEQAVAALQGEMTRWSGPDVLVVADTSFYLNHKNTLERLDLAVVLASRHCPVRLLVPMVVIDELDRLKQSGKTPTRTRARLTLRTLDQLLADPTKREELAGADWTDVDNHGGLPRGQVTVEVVFDPPAHARLPSNDQELIDRAVAVATLAERPVEFLTYDTGQSMRARAAGLTVRKLDRPTD